MIFKLFFRAIKLI